MSEELKPCPFCGGEAKLHTGITSGVPKSPTVYAYCTVCNTSGNLFEDRDFSGEFISEAIEAWNRRS